MAHTLSTARRSARIIVGAPLPLLIVLGATLAYTVWLTVDTVRTRFRRDVARMVFNDNSETLERAQMEASSGVDSLRSLLAASTPAEETGPYIVVSIADRHLWYKLRDSVLFEAPVATGSGKTLVVSGSTRAVRFETPRGRLVVQRRDSAPAWIPPDWHFQEQANKRGVRPVQLNRGEQIATKAGVVTVVGNDVVLKASDGTVRPYTASDGREIVVDGKLIIPPFGTNQRKYADVLGTHRLYLGDGYALHGTNQPQSVGQAVSHGCVRLRNEDIATLYDKVQVGTPVYIY